MIYQLLIIISTLLLGVGTLFYIYALRTFSYWKKRGVPYKEPSFIFGNYKQAFLQRKSLNEDVHDFYNYFGNRKFAGQYFFQKPGLMLRDPELIRTILIKDFHNFEDHAEFGSEESDPLNGKSLIRLAGHRWKHMRMKLTPTFTSGKMKKMFQLVCDCAQELQEFLLEAATAKDNIEVKDICAKYTTDVIASCAFGIQVNSLKNPNAEFRQMGKKLMSPPNFIQGLKFLLMIAIPWFAKVFKLSFISKDVEDFFRSAVKDTMNYREKHGIVRNDFLQLLIELKKKGKVEDEDHDTEHEYKLEDHEIRHIELTDDDLIAQAFIFFSGGFETSSTLLSFALYELAINPEVQKRLQAEIDEILERNEGQMTYQTVIHDMEYLDKVVSESLRKYPPLGVTDRMCKNPYKIPDTNVIIEPGTPIIIPIFAIHHDARFYPDPEKFDPERFNGDAARQKFGRTYLPFGDGPRMCIGLRFGLMQIKVGLVSLLSKYEFLPCEKTKVPFEFDPKSLIISGKEGTWVKIVQRNTNK